MVLCQDNELTKKLNKLVDMLRLIADKVAKSANYTQPADNEKVG